MAKEMVKLYLHVLNNRIYLTTPTQATPPRYMQVSRDKIDGLQASGWICGVDALREYHASPRL